MTDLQATLDAIDELAVHQCGHCSRPLPSDGESLDYCGPDCQAAWLAAKHEVDELVGYREPVDLAAHQANLVELQSPETTPIRPDWMAAGREMWSSNAGDLVFDLNIDTSRLQRAFADLMEQVSTLIVDELHHWQPRGILNTPGIRIEYDTTPISLFPEPPEPFGSDFAFDHTPARSIPHEPPPTVMPELPERDWQAVVDAATHRSELNRWRIMEQVRHDARVFPRGPGGFLRITGV